MTTTTNFGLTLPTVGADADAWGGELNTDLTTIDAALCRGQNIALNGDFSVNQRGYVSAAALASAAYGHDGWKGGASGGTYSFTQLASPTTITIAANKSLIQVIEDKNVVGGAYIVSWTGTATGRLTINSATPSGNFAVSPLTVTGQTAGTTMSLELTGANAAGGSSIATNTGTVGTVKLELGATVTPFIPDDFAIALERCGRTCRTITLASGGDGITAQAQTNRCEGGFLLQPPMRAAPSTVTFPAYSTTNGICVQDGTGTLLTGGSWTVASIGAGNFRVFATGIIAVAGQCLLIGAVGGAQTIIIDAGL